MKYICSSLLVLYSLPVTPAPVNNPPEILSELFDKLASQEPQNQLPSGVQNYYHLCTYSHQLGIILVNGTECLSLSDNNTLKRSNTYQPAYSAPRDLAVLASSLLDYNREMSGIRFWDTQSRGVCNRHTSTDRQEYCLVTRDSTDQPSSDSGSGMPPPIASDSSSSMNVDILATGIAAALFVLGIACIVGLFIAFRDDCLYGRCFIQPAPIVTLHGTPRAQ